MRRAPAHSRLKEFIERNGLKASNCAEALTVSAAAVSMWISGRIVPTQKHRIALESWTGGEIKAAEWETADERAAKRIVSAKRAS